VVSSAQRLDIERFAFYVDLAVSAFSGAARKALEAYMQRGSYEYQSEFARKYVAEGREVGRQEGRQEGELVALLEVLEARGLTVDDTARQQILACTDPAQLKRWLREAVTVRSVQELFER
jgi:predicted transposase YdaD